MAFDLSIEKMLRKETGAASFILDEYAVITAMNEEGAAFLPKASTENVLFKYFSHETGNRLREYFTEVRDSGKKSKKSVRIGKTPRESQDYSVIITPFVSEKNEFYLFTIFRNENDLSNKSLRKIFFHPEGIDDYFGDERLKRIIKEVKSNYPFTFISKTKIQKLADDLDEFFWIKDNFGKYVLVNQKYSEWLGYDQFQVERRLEGDFLTPALLDIYKTVDEYIIKSCNGVIIGGLKTLYSNRIDPVDQVVEFPVYDERRSVMAIIGFSLGSENREKTIEGNPLLKEAIKNIDKSIVIINDENRILTASNLLRELMNISPAEKLEGENISFILPDELIDQINRVRIKIDSQGIESSEDEIEIKTPDEKIYGVDIHRLINAESGLGGLSLVFAPKEENYQKSNSRSDDMYDVILHTSPEAVFIYDIENLQFLDVNDPALKLYGYSREEFLHMDLTDLYAPEDIQTLIEASDNKMKMDGFSGPWRHKKKDGSSVLVKIGKNAIDYKERRAHINIIHDVTQKAEDDKNLQLYRSAFQFTQDMIFVTDKDGFISEFNETPTKNLNYTHSDLTEKQFLSVVSDDDRGKVNTTIFQSDDPSVKELKVGIKTKSGEIKDASATAVPVVNYKNEIEKYSIIVRLAPVAEAPQQVAKPVEEPKESGGELDSSFLSHLFHEILTPINVIIGFAQELIDSLPNPTDDQRESADIISENQKMLIQIMDTAGEYAQIIQKDISIEPSNIKFIDLLDQLEDNTKKTAESKGVTLAYGKISSSLAFETDKYRFQTLLTAFTNFGMQITGSNKIYVSATAYDRDSISVGIKDESGGISEHLINGLQDVFSEDEAIVRQKYGFSRFSVRLIRKLSLILSAKQNISYKNDTPNEYCLVIPKQFTMPENISLSVEAVDEKPVERAVERPAPAPTERYTAQPERQPEPLRWSGESGREEEKPAAPQRREEPARFREPEPPKPAREPDFMRDPEPSINVPPPSTPKWQEPEPQPSYPLRSTSVPPEIEKPAVEPPQQTTEEKGIDLPSLACLYLEDQVDSQILFRVQMKDLKAIDFANSLENAMPLIKKKQFDFIVMDINLQGEYNGLDALRIIQRLPGYQNVPVIAVTAYVLPGDREKFIAAGFSDFISKPILRDKLTDVLGRIIK